jgi:hypothetical protein
VVSVVAGKRTAMHTQLLVDDFQRRTGGRRMNLLTSDEYPAYPQAIFQAYAEVREPPRTGRLGRPQKPVKVLAKELK